MEIVKQKKGKKLLEEKRKQVMRDRQLYAILLPFVLFFILFAYKPMISLVIAFKDYSMRKGVMGSEWVGFANFTRLFQSYWFPIILKNTLTLSVLSLVVSFPLPIILALVLNEVQNAKFRKFFQTVSYAPHFISTVIVCSMVTLFLSPSAGIINHIIAALGGERFAFMQSPEAFKWIYVISGVWQGLGWSSIIFFATLSINGILK